MTVEIINTSRKPLPQDLEDALIRYAPYHEFREQRNRVTITTPTVSYDVRGIFIKVDEDHVTIWMAGWYIQPKNE